MQQDFEILFCEVFLELKTSKSLRVDESQSQTSRMSKYNNDSVETFAKKLKKGFYEDINRKKLAFKSNL
jgi:hypothetical protein